MAPRPSSRLIPEDADPRRVYTTQEQEALAKNLASVLQEVHAGAYSSRKLDLSLLEELHRAIFAEVRSYAGKARGPGQGSEHVVFGPHRSFHANDVEPGLQVVWRELEKSLQSLRNNPDHPEYDLTAIRVSLWAHAEIIRVHPFEDGNGRASRAMMSLLLVRCGMRPIPMEAPKQEYLACLNHYYRTNDITPLLDLALRLYPDT